MAAFAKAGEQVAGECGDFTAPAIAVQSPTEGQQFDGRIDIRASATDGGVGLGRITFAYDGAQEIRNFTDGLTSSGSAALTPWFGSSTLPLGPHTIEVSALDKNGNTASKVVNVVKVAPGTVKAAYQPTFKLGKRVSCGKRKAGVTTCTLKGLLSRGAAGLPSIEGKVAVEWQWKNAKGRFRKLTGGLKPAAKAFTFKGKLKKKGAWRVRVVYAGAGVYKPATSKFLTFRVK